MEEDSELPFDRESIRANLSQMSFEDLQKLKEKIGTKVYNETVFGTSNKKRKASETQTDFKRENKNRPREMSSKRPYREKQELFPAKKSRPRDPRFDPLCGTFNEEVFQKSYKFLDSVKEKERKQLKEELKNTTDPKRQNKIKYLIQRLDNQLREKKRREKEEERANEEKKTIKEQIKKGEKPEYQKKSEKTMLNLLSQYEELKQNKKLKKHIERKSKKLTSDFKKKQPDNFGLNI